MNVQPPNREGAESNGPLGRCPAEAELAAFADGVLSRERSEAVARHVLSCPECTDVIASIAHRTAEADVAHEFAWPRWVASIAAVAVLAMVGGGVGWVWWRSRIPARLGLAELARAAGQERVVEARLSGGFAWGPMAAVRGGASQTRGLAGSGRAEIAGEAARLRGIRVQADPGGDAHALGVAYLLLGNVDDAVSNLESAAEDAPNDPAVLSDLAAARIEKGKLPQGAHELVRALDLTEQALAISPHMDEARFNKAVALEHLGLRDAAAEAWDDYINADRTSAWSTEAASRSSQLREEAAHKPSMPDPHAFVTACAANDGNAIDAFIREHPQQASDTLMSELGRWAEGAAAGNSSARAVLDGLANGVPHFTRIVGDPVFEQAVTEIRAASTDVERSRRLAKAHNEAWQGRSSVDDMRSGEARRLLTDASEQFARLGSPYRDVAELYLLSSWYYIGPSGDYFKTLATLVDRYPAGGKQIVGARARWLQGLSLSVSGNTFVALSSLAAATDSFSAMGFQADATFVRSIEATAWWMLGQTNRAWDLQREIFLHLDAVTDPRRAQVIVAATAKGAESEGERLAALTIGQASLAFSKLYDSPFDRCDGLVWYASAAVNAGREAVARGAVVDARAELARVADPDARSRLDATLNLVEGRLILNSRPIDAIALADTAARWFEKTDRENLLTEAYQLRGQARERAGDLDGAAGDYLHALEAVERQRDRVRDAPVRTSFVDRAWDLSRDMVRLEVDRGNWSRGLALADRIRATTVSSAGELISAAALDPVDELVHQLRPDEAVIFYAFLEHRAVVWTLRPGRVSSTILPIEYAEIAHLVASQKRELNTSVPVADSEAGRTLFQRLIEPLRVHIRGVRRIVIVPEGPLHALSWGALPTGTGNQRWIDAISLAVAPSLRCLIGHRHTGASNEDLRVVAVGNPAFDRSIYPELPGLPGAETEARAIGAVYRKSTVLVGAEATPERVLEETTHAQVLHVAAHAIPGAIDPEQSTIVLAPGGTIAPQGGLTPRDIRQHDMRNLRVIVLAACRSGDGPLSRIEGPLSLARPLLENGARNVVVSLYDLPDRASASIMTTLHGQLRDGAEPIEALRRAELDCWASKNPDSRTCGGLQLIVNEPMED